MAVIGPVRRSPWGRPLPVSVGSLARTYADFVAHITGLATGGAVAWSNVSIASAAGAYYVVASTADGDSFDMYGTPWVAQFSRDASPTWRVVQHSMPSLAEFTAQRTAGRSIFIRLTDASTGLGEPGLSRNGYTSLTGGTGYAKYFCTELIYWDGAQAQRMQPSLGLGPTPYTW